MTNGKPADIPLRDRLAFFLEFLRYPLQIGSVTPSSRFLVQRILKHADITSAMTIVELGPGTGGTTQAISRQTGCRITTKADLIPVSGLESQIHHPIFLLRHKYIGIAFQSTLWL